MARLSKNEWYVSDVEKHSTVVEFFREHHYSKSCANTSTYRHGLFNKETGELHGIAAWIPPTKSAAISIANGCGWHDWQGVLSLTRLAVIPETPANACSFLLSRSSKRVNPSRWPVLVTYADTYHGHTGAIYKASNWTFDRKTAAGDTWLDATGRQCGRKRGGKTLNRAQMELMGCTKLPSMPKLRFVLNRSMNIKET